MRAIPVLVACFLLVASSFARRQSGAVQEAV
jgi:hypothetical protein